MSGHPPFLILTGGTISSARNAQGLLVPDAARLDKAIESAGLHDAKKEWIFSPPLDSIDFNIGEHYPKMLEAARGALMRGETPVVIGGTDTLAWYSSLLTRDLERQGFLTDERNEKIIFLSSIKSKEEAPQHVVNVLKAGKRFSEVPVSGGFAVCAEDEKAEQFAIHDVTNHLDKISGELTNAFRTKCPVGYLNHDTYSPALQYTRPALSSGERSARFSRIAPPLLSGYDSEAMTIYMKTMYEAHPPLDGVIIEGFPGATGKLLKRDNMYLESAVRALTSEGVRVIFCNPMRFNNHSQHMAPLVPDSRWLDNAPSPGSLRSRLADAGAEFTTSTPRDAWLEATLDAPRISDTGRTKPVLTLSHERRQSEVGIRYVPDASVMQEAINALAPKTKNLLFSALPHKVIPDNLSDTILANKRTTKFSSRFEYDNNQYVDGAGEVFSEGKQANPYEAGQATGSALSASARSLSDIKR